jgi:hypothetical protein
MCAACAHKDPSASNRAQEKSNRSLILGEKEVRRKTKPISSQMDVTLPENNLRSIGFIGVLYNPKK